MVSYNNLSEYNDLLGYIAIIFLSLSFFPQIYIIIKNKNADSVSYSTYYINGIASILLIIYAINRSLLPILLGNSIVLATSIIIIYLKYRYSQILQ
jgi:MtN3 and saliva related transmembrane protein